MLRVLVAGMVLVMGLGCRPTAGPPVASGEESRAKASASNPPATAIAPEQTPADKPITAAVPTALPLGGEKQAIHGEAPSARLQVIKQDFAPPLSFAKVSRDADLQSIARNKEGLKLHRAGKFSEAEAKYLAALKANPGHVLARYNLASVLVRAGKHDRALALLDELLQAKGCAKCDLGGFVIDDQEWQPLWDSLVFRAVLNEATAGATGEVDIDADDSGPGTTTWLKSFCKPGETRKGRIDENGEGTVTCMKGGKKHGNYYRYELGYDMSEGTLRETGAYKNGTKHGSWSHSETYGTDFWGSYKEGKKHGQWTEDEKDTTTYQVFLAGKLQGTVWVVSSGEELPVGYVLAQTAYKDGKKNGVAKTWSLAPDTRVLDESGSYLNDQKHGPWIDYDDSTGRPLQLVTYSKGLIEGPYRYWDESGKLLAEGAIRDGTGTWVMYEQGKKVEAGEYRRHKKDGPWIEKEAEGAYSGGQRSGQWLLKLGDNRAQGQYQGDQPVGEWTYSRASGAVYAKGSFTNGVPHGEWTTVEARSNSTLKARFQLGKLISVDGERVKPKQWEYSRKDFLTDPRLEEPVDDIQ